MNMKRRFVLYGYMQSFCLIFSSLVAGMKLDGFFLRVGQFFSVIPVKNSDILRITCIYSSKCNYYSFDFYVLVKTITFLHTVKYKSIIEDFNPTAHPFIPCSFMILQQLLDHTATFLFVHIAASSQEGKEGLLYLKDILFFGLLQLYYFVEIAVSSSYQVACFLFCFFGFAEGLVLFTCFIEGVIEADVVEAFQFFIGIFYYETAIL